MTLTLDNIPKQLAFAGLTERAQQNLMIEAVAQAIKNENILCIEAPTGTGKTLAYCLGALIHRKEQETVIISTATTALQDQFFQKDLPLLEHILGKKLSVVLAKGRRRYVCHARLYNPEDFIESHEYTFQLNELQQLLDKRKWQGESDKLPFKIDPGLWQKISTDASGCTAGRCEYFEDCVFFQNRRKMHHADIIVINHSLLLADLELGGGVILPEMKNNVYIIDECHHLPEKALSHFAKQAALIRSFEWINAISKNLNKAALQIKLKEKNNEEINFYTKTLVEELWKVKQYLDEQSSRFVEGQWRLIQVENSLVEIATNINLHALKLTGFLKSILTALDLAYEKLIIEDKQQAEVISHLQGTFNFIIERCENLAATWGDLLANANQSAKKLPLACWFEKVISKKSHEEADFTLHTSPINVSESLQNLFWDKVTNGVVLCSGTIRAMGEFNDFIRKIGLKDNSKLQIQALTSPFEFQHSVLFVPAMKTEPHMHQQDMHLAEMLELLPHLVLPSSGTLVLFTSRKAMEEIYQKIPTSLKQAILLQDHYGKMEIINLHKERIDEGKRSIIFGVASLAEGIDLPGKYCQHVIIQKIPFTVPSDPISQTRADWLKSHQRDPFQLITLPETSIKLTQYIGRLLRNEKDRGIITILDKRLYSKSYGKGLLASLPPFTYLINQPLAEFQAHSIVQTFFESI